MPQFDSMSSSSSSIEVDVEPEELVLELDHLDLQLAAQAWGPADGFPILGIHGWLDNAATWSGVAPQLAAYVDARLRYLPRSIDSLTVCVCADR